MRKDSIQKSRVQCILPYFKYMADRQLPVGQLLARHGLDRCDLKSPLAHLPTKQLLAFTHDIATETNDYQIGLNIAKATKPEDTVCLGIFMTYARTIREALELTVSSMGASQNHALYRLSPETAGTSFVFRLDNCDAVLARYEIEHLAAEIVKHIRLRLGSSWSPVEVHFEHALKGRLSAYEEYFRAPVFFEQAVNHIVMRPQDLEKESNAPLNAVTIFFREQFFDKYVTKLRGEMDGPQTLAGRVALVVSQKLGEADCTLASVASKLNMSARSLQRHLATEGSSFQDVVKQQRHHIAMNLIKADKRATTSAIAASLGYSDRTALSRAFKSWTGNSPKTYSSDAGYGSVPERSVSQELPASVSG